MKPLRYLFGALGGALALLLSASSALASESDLILPDLSVPFHGIAGNKLLTFGLVICALGMVFGLVIYKQLKNIPVHKSMRDVSEIIYETCKTYLFTQEIGRASCRERV